jgi:hypothetical protein
MKIYEKPMAIIEKINVEDVITTSAEKLSSGYTEAGKVLESETTIVFEW